MTRKPDEYDLEFIRFASILGLTEEEIQELFLTEQKEKDGK